MTSKQTMTDKPRRLGRGLEALISSASSHAASHTVSHATSDEAGSDSSAPQSPLQSIPVANIRPNPFQPRHDFQPEELAELEASIRASGLLQPVTVRSRPDNLFELVAGERRFRAVTQLGWTTIPALVKQIDDRAMLTLALIENLQRADLNPIDEARGYQRLLDEFTLTQQQVADAVGKDRSTISNFLRILQLPDGIKHLLQDGTLSLGHARALLALPDQRAMLDAAKQIIDTGMSVRGVELLAQNAKPTGTKPRAKKGAPKLTTAPGSAQIRQIGNMLRRHFQTDVRITADSENKGDIVVRFYSSDDLQRILDLMRVPVIDDLH